MTGIIILSIFVRQAPNRAGEFWGLVMVMSATAGRGIEFSNGYARAGHWQPGNTDTFVYAAELQENAITRGRTKDTKATRVATFGGSAFKPRKDATAILVFSANPVSHEVKKARELTADTPTVSING